MYRIILLFAFALTLAAQSSTDNSGARDVRPWPIRQFFPGVCRFGEMMTRIDLPVGSNTFQCGFSNDWNLLGGGGATLGSNTFTGTQSIGPTVPVSIGTFGTDCLTWRCVQGRTPIPTPNLKAYYDFSPGPTSSTLYDRWGRFNGTAGNPATPPTYVLSGAYFSYDTVWVEKTWFVKTDETPLRLAQPWTIHITLNPSNAATMPNLVAQTNKYLVTKGGDDWGIIWGFVSGTVELYSAGVDIRSGSQVSTGLGGTFHTVSYSYDGANLKSYLDGAPVATTPKTVVLPGSIGSVYFGATASQSNVNSFDGILSAFAVYGAVQTDADVLTTATALQNATTRSAPGTIVFDGDSLTAGSYLTANNDRWPNQMMPSLGVFDWYNIAIGGQKVSTMNTNAAANVDTKYGLRGNPRIAVLWGGTNDLALATVDNAATVYSRIVTYCQARQAVGWKVVVLTMLPRNEAGLPVDFETSRQTINTNIRTLLPSSCPGVVIADVAANPIIGAPGAYNNPTYYRFDLIHLLKPGYTIVAGIVQTAITPLLSIAP